MATALALACTSGGAYPAPKSDTLFDDPDDPGNTGNNGTRPDAAGDASNRSCGADRDCPAVFRCGYAREAGCAATGACILRDPCDAACVPMLGCGCSGSNIVVCECDDFATEPLLKLGKCAVPVDAAAIDAADDAAIDAVAIIDAAPDVDVADAGVGDASAD